MGMNFPFGKSIADLSKFAQKHVKNRFHISSSYLDFFVFSDIFVAGFEKTVNRFIIHWQPMGCANDHINSSLTATTHVSTPHFSACLKSALVTAIE